MYIYIYIYIFKSVTHTDMYIYIYNIHIYIYIYIYICQISYILCSWVLNEYMNNKCKCMNRAKYIRWKVELITTIFYN